MADRFLIAPLQKGQENSVKPWLIPDQAFAQLRNAYVFRGRIRKRFGSFLLNQSVDPSVAQLYSRLRINLGNTSGAGALAGNVPGAVFEIGQQFSVGSEIFTVYQNGAMYSTGAGTGTYNTATGAYNITGAAAATAVYFYPAQPVMGIKTREKVDINDEQPIAFDTQFSYQYLSGGWELIGTGAGSSLWTGTDSDFFWATNWRGAQNYETLFFATNYVAADRIRYYDGSTWTIITPQYDATATNVINGCRIILPFKDRLVLLNTIEFVTASGANQTFVNRCRFSQNGSPIAATAFRQETPGLGGYIDAPTKEAIISAEFLKDRLIVYFERSTWELVYTGNQVLPFVWQKINTELGAESTFSIVPFDKAVLGVGNVGIHACSGANVERIDDLIPDEVFEVSNSNEGVKRVYGIRDYYTELVYWSFPSSDDTTLPYPNRILVYNYATQTWAFNDDTVTCFGYFQNTSGLTWALAKRTWAEATVAWKSASLKNKFRQIIAGNQQGWTFICSADAPTRNAPALQISNVSGPSSGLVTLTVVSHNLLPGEFIYIESCSGSTELNDNVYQVWSTPTANTLTIQYSGASVTAYKGAGTVARVSRIDIYTKQYNFYVQEARNCTINKIDWLFDRTATGEVTIDYYLSSGNQPMNVVGSATGALVDTGALQTYPYTLVPFEGQQDRLWHTTYPIANGECIQMRIYLSDTQMIDTDISFSDFTLHAFAVFAQVSGSRLQ